jgi:hypothetical protein
MLIAQDLQKDRRGGVAHDAGQPEVDMPDDPG